MSHGPRHRFLIMLSPALLLLFFTFYLFSSLTRALPGPVAVNLHDDGEQEHDSDERNGHRRGQLGAIASEQAICSGIGADMLKVGGNAADAVRRSIIMRLMPC